MNPGQNLTNFVIKSTFPLFLETLHIADGIVLNPNLHQERFSATRAHFFPDCRNLDLQSLVHPYLKGSHGRIRLTVVYDENILEIRLQPYTPKKIRKLRLVYDNTVSYPFKFSDRDIFDRLLWQKGEADEILIVKNNRITDASYANLIFKKGNKWFTPSEPLLPGTKRKKLLLNGFLREAEISVNDLAHYEEVSLINAMLDPGEISLRLENAIL